MTILGYTDINGTCIAYYAIVTSQWDLKKNMACGLQFCASQTTELDSNLLIGSQDSFWSKLHLMIQILGVDFNFKEIKIRKFTYIRKQLILMEMRMVKYETPGSGLPKSRDFKNRMESEDTSTSVFQMVSNIFGGETTAVDFSKQSKRLQRETCDEGLGLLTWSQTKGHWANDAANDQANDNEEEDYCLLLWRNRPPSSYVFCNILPRYKSDYIERPLLKNYRDYELKALKEDTTAPILKSGSEKLLWNSSLYRNREAFRRAILHEYFRIVYHKSCIVSNRRGKLKPKTIQKVLDKKLKSRRDFQVDRDLVKNFSYVFPDEGSNSFWYCLL